MPLRVPIGPIGLETLESYGVRVLSYGAANFAKAQNELRTALPAAHVNFLRSLKLSFSRGRYFFCHAGVRPGVPLDCQSEEDLLCIREPFLASAVDFGKIIVHGHTPMPEPVVLPNRIGIDTGAFATGGLTCVALDNAGAPRFLRA